jgi:hypothetical protein
VGLSEGTRPLGTTMSTSIWEDDIKTNLQQIGQGDVERIHLAQDKDRWRPVVNTVMSLRVSQNSGDCFD